MGLLSSLFGKKKEEPEIELAPLSGEHSAFIQEKAIAAVEFLHKYDSSKESYTPNDIDSAINQWRDSNLQNREKEEDLIDILGAYFGNLLVNTLPVEWYIFTDKHGPEFSVIHKDIFVYSFPFSAILKAVVDGRKDALQEVKDALEKQIEENSNNPEVMPRNDTSC